MARSHQCTVLSISLLIVLVRAQCYLPNGTYVGGLRVCDPNAEASACCAPGDECTTNGFCKAGNDADNNWLWRGTCTDQTWKSPHCPQYCYNSTTGPRAANVDHLVLACSPDQYCCGYDGQTYDPKIFSFDCCTDSLRLFDAGPALYLAGFAVTTSIFLGFTSISTSATSSSTSATVSSMTSTTMTTSTLSSVVSSTASPTWTTTAAAIPGLSTGAQAGIGVGVSIGVICLLGLGILVGLKLRRSKPAQRDAQLQAQIYDDTTMPPRYEKPAAVNVLEAGGWQRPLEADSNVRAELEGNLAGDGQHPFHHSRSGK